MYGARDKNVGTNDNIAIRLYERRYIARADGSLIAIDSACKMNTNSELQSL